MNPSTPNIDQGVQADPALAELVEELTARLKAGEAVDLDAWLTQRPEQADELRRLFPMLRLLADLSRSGEMSVPPALCEDALTGTLGDFRLIREVGRGGMGIVYEAKQISLGRRVALKVLPFAATLDPRHLQRFHNEARAAAGLHHTNIVPVYAVGIERGVHYYAMQFIDGHTLAELIAQQRHGHLPAPPTVDEAAAAPASTVPPAAQATSAAPRDAAYYRRAAEWGIQAAEALDCAHSLGVVHRDVKPANLLLDPTGRLWVTDFGLAQVQCDTKLTMTGDLVGTLRYMSPEQALAQRVVIDHRTDVYSLGATLYELLALEPAFGGADRQELLRQVAFEEPRSPRRLNKAIPAELETIVLKAMEKNPAERYATAQELADDLRRWLEDRPIRARRPPLWTRLGRWARQHKPLVAGALAALVMGLAVLAAASGWVARDHEARRTKNREVVSGALEDSASWQRQGRLPEALSAARRAEGLLAGADVDDALRQQVRARLADLELLDSLQNVRLERATAIKDNHFDWEGTDSLYSETFRGAGLDVEALSAEEAGERLRRTTVAAELAAMLDDWAWVRRRTRGQDDPSWKALLRVARLADPDAWRTRVRKALERNDLPALRAAAASEEVLRLPPATLSVLGNALGGDKEARGQAETFLRQAQRLHSGDFWLAHLLIEFFHNTQPPQPEEAIRFAAVAVALRPSSAEAHLALGAVLADMGRTDEAIAEFREAIRLKKDCASPHYSLGSALYDKGRLDEAITEFREAIRIKMDYAEAHGNLGITLRAKGGLDEAIAEYREAIRINKDSPEAHYNLGLALRDKGRSDEAIAEYREAIRIDKDHFGAHNNLGAALADKGRPDEAIAEYREAIRLRKDYAEAHINLGLALRGKGRPDEAIAEYREAIRIDKDHFGAHTNLGNALRDKGRPDEAIAEYREAIRINKDFALAHHNLGITLRDKGRLEEAITEFREAIRINKDFALAHCNLGLALCNKGQFAEALAELRRGHELGLKNPRWAYPSAELVKQCERLVELDAKLPRVLKGEVQPADVAERLTLAEICHYKSLYAAAVRFYAAAFAAEPKLNGEQPSAPRYNAACAAALAGCGRGKDVEGMGEEEAAHLRQQALDWLRADLGAWRRHLEKGPVKDRPVIVGQLRHCLEDPDLAGVRGKEPLARLTEAERLAWQKLWADVADTLARAEKQIAAEKNSTPK
jgi:serine/threonine protein kinase/Tfp pilus assembly protein PilF